jgi:hypothetical protein
MGVLYTHSPKSPGPFSTLPKKKVNFFDSSGRDQPPTASCMPAVVRASFFVHCALSFQTPAPPPSMHFWSTLSHWLQNKLLLITFDP